MSVIHTILEKIGDFLNGLKSRLFPSAGKRRVRLTKELKVDLQWTQWVRVRKKSGEEQVFSGEELTSEQAVQLMDQTLGGKFVYFAMDFMFQGEGEYVKRLKKTVYRPFHSTLVLHHGSGNMACLFFAGDSLCCYRLIGDFDAYNHIDISELRQLPTGDVTLPEDIVFRKRGEIDRALCMLFADLEHADKQLAQSTLWSADIAWPGGVNNYNRRRRELGLLADS